MATKVFLIDKPEEFRKACGTDLVRLLPARGKNPLFIPKWLLRTMVYGMATGELIHLSGPTGSAKTSLIEALTMVPENFRAVLSSISGIQPKPVKVFPVEMATFEAPSELYFRRAINSGNTFDEDSSLVSALVKAAKEKDACFPLIWLREMGRVQSPSVQGGLLNLLCRGEVTLHDGRCLDLAGVAFIADSNYQAAGSGVHTLVSFDDALKRRFGIQITLSYLTAEQEVAVLQNISKEMGWNVSESLILTVVKLGQIIRAKKGGGGLASIVPPTIYGYLSFLRMAISLPEMGPTQVALVTLLGNAESGEQNEVFEAVNEVFGIKLAPPGEGVPSGGSLC